MWRGGLADFHFWASREFWQLPKALSRPAPLPAHVPGPFGVLVLVLGSTQLDSLWVPRGAWQPPSPAGSAGGPC